MGAEVGPGPALRPAENSRPWCGGRANSRDLLRARGRRVSFPLQIDPKDRCNVGGGSCPHGLQAQGAWDAAWKPAPRGARASGAQLAPRSALLSPASESLPAAAAARSLRLPPPRVGLRFPSINSRPNSIREGSFELLCLLGEMWAQEGSRYNFHFLKCLREHPEFLSPRQAGRWVRVSGPVTQLSPNKRSSQSPGEGELPAIHDPWSR